jgi:hypothetical protein
LNRKCAFLVGTAANNLQKKFRTLAMSPRLLIINCASPYFFYIPMGTFGLCDYLGQRNLFARIFNPALYHAGEVKAQLLAALTAVQPTHVGFVLHWQETAHGLLAELATVKAWNSEAVTFCGGFTAAYFAEDLLATQAGLDYVIVGDPEEPVAQLLLGRPPESIGNLVRRDESGMVHRNERYWLIEQPLLDSISFAGLHFLIDADRYLEKINTKLGFPVFLGRGCVFDCAYCGGSRHAFRLHSGRHAPVTRSLAAILADLHVLKGQTRLLYICYENDLAFVTALFQAIAEDEELKGHFTLHYGAWHLLDRQLLECYRNAFNTTGTPPLFEFSPEVFSDATRTAIKRVPTYTIEQLCLNIREIVEMLNGRVRIELFFSRYHPAITAPMLEQEIRNIFLLKHRLFLQGSPQVHLCFDHLSTDVGSRYWEEHIENPRIFSTLLHLKQGVDEGTLHSFPVDNLCLFIPDHLPQEFRVRIEALLFVLEKLERHCRELFHILFASLGERWLHYVMELLAPCLGGEARPTFFSSPPLEALLDGLEQRLSSENELLLSIPFLADLVRFSRKKLNHASLPTEPSTPTGYFVINMDCVTIHEHDYLELIPFIQRFLQSNGSPLVYQRTVYFILNNGMVALPHAFYRTTFKYFEQPRTLASYQSYVRIKNRFNLEQHDQLLSQLIKDGLLLQASEPMLTLSCQVDTSRTKS